MCTALDIQMLYMHKYNDSFFSNISSEKRLVLNNYSFTFEENADLNSNLKLLATTIAMKYISTRKVQLCSNGMSRILPDTELIFTPFFLLLSNISIEPKQFPRSRALIWLEKNLLWATYKNFDIFKSRLKLQLLYNSV